MREKRSERKKGMKMVAYDLFCSIGWHRPIRVSSTRLLHLWPPFLHPLPFLFSSLHQVPNVPKPPTVYLTGLPLQIDSRATAAVLFASHQQRRV